MDDVRHEYTRYAISVAGVPLVEKSTFFKYDFLGMEENDHRLRELPNLEGKWFLFAIAGAFFDVPPHSESSSEYWLGGYGSLPNSENVEQLISQQEFDTYVETLNAAKQNAINRMRQDFNNHRARAREKLEKLGLDAEEIAAIMRT